MLLSNASRNFCAKVHIERCLQRTSCSSAFSLLLLLLFFPLLPTAPPPRLLLLLFVVNELPEKETQKFRAKETRETFVCYILAAPPRLT